MHADLALLLGIGVTATLAQLAMTRAYGYGHTLVAQPAVRRRGGGVTAGHRAVFDRIPPVGWIGILVIIGGGVLSTALVARQRGTLPAANN
jgi:hypothetical protein